jgi:hypothetical protein
MKILKTKKERIAIEELTNEYKYHAEEILKDLDSQGYELSGIIGIIEEIIKYNEK